MSGGFPWGKPMVPLYAPRQQRRAIRRRDRAKAPPAPLVRLDREAAGGAAAPLPAGGPRLVKATRT